MRLAKLIGLAALAAMVAMAFAGTGSALAKGEGNDTVLCKTNQHPCPSEKIYEAATEISAQAEDPQLKIHNIIFLGTEEVICEESQVEGKTKEEKGQGGTSETELEGHIENLTFTGDCHIKGRSQKCTVHTQDEEFDQTPYQALLEQDGNTGDGKMFVFEQAGGQPGALVECDPILGIAVDCIYKGAEENAQEPEVDGVNFEVEGSETQPQVIAGQEGKQAILKEAPEGGHDTCPGNTPEWESNYHVHEPVPGWVSHA